MNNRRRHGCIALLALAALPFADAWAACSFTNGQTFRAYNLTIPSVTIPRDAAVGTVLADVNATADPSSGAFANCSSPGTAVRVVNGTSQVTGGPTYTFATNLPGVGIRYYDLSYGNTRYWGEGAGGSYVGNWTWSGTKLGVQLVVTGPVSSGTLATLPTGAFSLDGLQIATINLVPGTTVVGSTCRVDSTSTDVTLPVVRVSDFPQVGATAGERAFSLSLDCSMAGNANVHITFTDNNQPGSTGTLLSLSPDSSSKGLQLQLYHNGTAIALGPDSAQRGTTHQIGLGSASSLSRIPLTVRYVRTDSVTPGTVSAVATFTLSYQ